MNVLPLPVIFQNDCGFQALHWFVAVAEHSPVDPVAQEEACAMRFQFALTLLGDAPRTVHMQDLRVGGGSDVEQALSSLLRDRGVFEDRLSSRSEVVFAKLFKAKVAAALQSSNAWQALKQLANQASPKVQLILQDEFDQLRQNRVSQNKPVGLKKKHARAAPMQESRLHVSTADIFLPDGVFKQSDGCSLSQLPMRDISPGAAGVVLGSESELQPFISRPQISNKGLALAVVEPSMACVQSFGPVLRFPVGCISTQEPLIINAVLIQKGALEVIRNRPEKPPQVQETSNLVFKLMVYKDEHGDDWIKVVQAPIRFVFDLIPQLQTCVKPDCSCPRRHEPLADQQDAVLDVWNRDWLSIKFQKVGPKEAVIFACHIRVTSNVGQAVIKASGFGLYAEARSSDGKRDDANAHTVWLTRKTLPEAQADLAIAPGGTTLIRVGQRFGLRAPLPEAEELHLKLRQDLPFLAGANKCVWQMAPLPWGATRKSVQALLDQWNWKARPLQPCGRSSDSSGLAWQVLSVGPPPHTVYSLQHGDLLITEVRPKHTLPAAQLPRIEAGKRTKAFLVSQQQPAQDPWQQGQDPWGQFVSSQSQKPITDSLVTKHQLSTFEASIEAKLASKLQAAQDVSMDDQVSSRVIALEQQMQQVLHQQTQQSHQTSAIAGQVNVLANRIEEQAKSFEATVEHALDTKLSSHMARLESLITKRQRQE